eukprot:TRINITY_DN86103_c0_g1_i1.p1 TRINITY_DN86103_c0_g1~~TRINITY_DN86103_c0_g1_i1.p1  ORF type:complete len:227 (-),score=23.88 TRINITY_DN86103_c0_g1_i1:67-747(-)
MLSVERHIAVAWFCATGNSLLVARVQFEGGVWMCTGIALAFLVVLLLLDRRTPMAGLLLLGYISSAVILGLQTIDLAFDLVILRNEVPPLGVGARVCLGGDSRELQAIEVGWIYYHTMLSQVHVNIVVTFCVSLAFLGALALAARSTAEDMKRWRVILVVCTPGVFLYVFGIIPTYFRLYREEAFDPSLFESWQQVVVARVATILMIMLGQIIAFPLIARITKRDA